MCSFTLVIHFFLLEFQSQKRNSTDAGIQTEPLAGSAAAEKSKWKRAASEGSPVQTDSPPLPSISPPLLCLSSFHPVSSTLTKSVCCHSSWRRWNAWLSSRKVIESAAVWTCWQIYIFFGDKCPDKVQLMRTFLQTFNVTFSLCFQPDHLGS